MLSLDLAESAGVPSQIRAKSIAAEEIRSEEYAYLDQQEHIYLDYAGAGLASRTQIQRHAARLQSCTSGNPHSINPTSEISNALIAKARLSILQFLNACPSEYAVIFTANATGAARLVGESYQFGKRSRLVLTADNHNSINGLREFAQKAKAHTEYVPIQRNDLKTASTDVEKALRRRKAGCFSNDSSRNLFAYPAQSNFSGVIHPLSWIQLAQDRGYDVLLDAAAYLPTNDLDLRQVRPEFVIISWYKLFGFPTGVGSLVVRRDVLPTLKRPWFSGGTVRAATVGVPWHALMADETAFEDGTLNFLSIPDVSVGIEWLRHLGRTETAARVHQITERFICGLQTLQHTDGSPMAIIYGPYGMKNRGGTVSFNILDVMGRIIDNQVVAGEAALAQISIRIGCFCNPGAGEAALGTSKNSIKSFIKLRSTASRDPAHQLPLASAIRASFGIASVPRDGDALINLIGVVYRDWLLKDKEASGSKHGSTLS